GHLGGHPQALISKALPSAPRWTRTINPLVTSQWSATGAKGEDLMILGQEQHGRGDQAGDGGRIFLREKDSGGRWPGGPDGGIGGDSKTMEGVPGTALRNTAASTYNRPFPGSRGD